MNPTQSVQSDMLLHIENEFKKLFMKYPNNQRLQRAYDAVMRSFKEDVENCCPACEPNCPLKPLVE